MNTSTTEDGYGLMWKYLMQWSYLQTLKLRWIGINPIGSPTTAVSRQVKLDRFFSTFVMPVLGAMNCSFAVISKWLCFGFWRIVEYHFKKNHSSQKTANFSKFSNPSKSYEKDVVLHSLGFWEILYKRRCLRCFMIFKSKLNLFVNSRRDGFVSKAAQRFLT